MTGIPIEIDRSKAKAFERASVGWESETPAASPERGSREPKLSDGLIMPGQYHKAEEAQENEGFVYDEEQKREKDKVLRRRWYSVVLFVIAVNFFLWMAVIYAVYRASEWTTDHYWYLVNTWLIFFIPLLVACFFIFSPWPQPMVHGRYYFLENGPAKLYPKYAVNVLNAAACFIIVLVYLYCSAIPEYNNIKWQMIVEYADTLTIPSFMFVVQHSGFNQPKQQIYNPFNYETQDNGRPTVFATIEDPGSNVDLVYPTDGIRTVPLNVPSDNDGPWSNFTAIVFDSSQLKVRNVSALRSQLTFSINGYWNSTTEAAQPGNVFRSMQVAAFDPRLSVDDMWNCGLVPWLGVEPFSVSTMPMTLMHVTDKLNTIKPPEGSSEGCDEVFRKKLSNTNPRFSFYEPRLSGANPAVDDFRIDCDVVTNAGNLSSNCFTAVRLEYGNQFVLTRYSQHGISFLDIFVNLGAAVGAVQFFAWFLLQAVGG